MEQDRNRRIIVLVALTFVLFFTPSMLDEAVDRGVKLGSSLIGSAMQMALTSFVGEESHTTRRKRSVVYENVEMEEDEEEAVAEEEYEEFYRGREDEDGDEDPYGDLSEEEALLLKDFERKMRKRMKRIEEDQEDDETSAYSKSLRGKSKLFIRTPLFSFDLYACLPRFICEVHAQPAGTHFSDLEKDILKLFRSYVVLEGPDSPVYPFQLAAHMGQLGAGFFPSTCLHMYPSCPLSRSQLIDTLRTVRASKRLLL